MLRSETLVLFTTTNRIQQTSYDVSVSKHRMKSPIAKAWKRSACNALNSKSPMQEFGLSTMVVKYYWAYSLLANQPG